MKRIVCVGVIRNGKMTVKTYDKEERKENV